MENAVEVKKDGIASFVENSSDVDGEWFRANGKTGEWSIDNEETDVTSVRIAPDLENAQAGELLPVCALGAKERGDANGNWNPVFKVITWVPASRFTSIDGVPRIAAPHENS